MANFNLTSSPWLPVRDHRGQPNVVSLLDLFQSSADWADLDLRPHERVAVMRLLVCIAQAALGAPETKADWPEFGTDFTAKTAAYLRQWQDGFDLLGDGRRFLQRRPAKEGEPTMVSKLVPQMATNNNPCNNDHGGGTKRAMEAPALGLALLTFQNFYPIYGAGYKGRGPCGAGNMLHTLLRGANLQRIILANCVDAETINESLGEIGLPLWEKWPASLSDKPAVDNARLTYLGRLVPSHRTMWICDDRAHVLVGQEGWVYPTFEHYQEPSATVIAIGKKGERQLWASLDRAIWRDLHALTVLGKSANSKAGAPLVVQSHQNPMETTPLDIWTGALVTDDAKILDTVESVFHLESRLFTAAGRGIYERGVAYSQTRLHHLRDAVREWGHYLRGKKSDQKLFPTAAAERHYWHALDQRSAVLLEIASDRAIGDLTFGGASQDAWTALVRGALLAAYEHACPRDTPRQIEAFALGLRALRPPPAKPKAKKTPKSAKPA